MKCPHCGYNSFESNDLCQRCSHDLTSHRLAFGLKPVVLRREARAALAAALTTESAPTDAPLQHPGQVADMFSFDLPPEPPAAPPRPEPFGDAVFSFNETPRSAAAGGREPAAPEPDPFADLLEPTRIGGGAAAPSAKTGSASPVPGAAPGEYDLSDFSWDDTPEPSGSAARKPADNFSNLFGSVEEPAKK